MPIMKYLIYTYSWHQDEQAQCSAVLHILWRKVHSHSLSVHHTTLLYASMETGKLRLELCQPKLNANSSSTNPILI